MLFAAGFGTRMGALTRNRPKPLIPVAGRALLDHTRDLVAAAGITRVVVNAHYLADQIVDHLAGTPVLISRESPDILDTGGGLRQALPLLGPGPVFTANTDVLWQGANPFESLRRAWRPDEMDALLLCVPPQNALGHDGGGDFLLGADGRLSRGAGLVYGGVQIIRTEGLEAIADSAFSLNLLWNEIAASGRLFGLCHDGLWCDVGHPGGIALGDSMLGGGDV